MQPRPLVPSEAPLLSRFGEACFRESFTSAFGPEAMDMLCRHAFAAPVMDHLIRLGTWVVEGPQGWLGYAALGEVPCPLDTLPPPVLELSRLYVARPYQGQGVADALMASILAAARNRQARSLWVQAYAGNPRALAFYRRMGFQDFGPLDVRLEGLVLPHRALGRQLG